MGARILRWVVTASILLFGSLFLVLGLGMHLQLLEARRLVQEGAQAQATVTESGTARRSTATRITYEFSAAGRTYTARDRSIPFAARKSLPAGASVRVWHDRTNPAKSVTVAELDEMEAPGNRAFFPLAGIALIAWAILRMRRAAAQRR